MGALDVDAMCDAITPEQFDEWIAYEQTEPDTDALLERASAILKLGFTMVAKAAGCNDAEPNWFEPDPKRREDADKPMSPNQMAAAVKVRCGSVNSNR